MTNPYLENPQAAGTAPAAGAPSREQNPYLGLDDGIEPIATGPAALAAQQHNPDQYARAQQASRQLGVPADVLARNPEEMRKLEVQRTFEMTRQRNPELASWLAGDAANATLAQDDIPVLQRIADVISAPTRGVNQFTGGAVAGLGELWDAGAYGLANLFGGEEYARTQVKPGANPLIRAGDWIKRGGIQQYLPDRDPVLGLDMNMADPLPEGRTNILTDVGEGLGSLAGGAALSFINPGLGLASFAGAGADQQAQMAKDAGQYGTGEAYAAIAISAPIAAALEKTGLDKLLDRAPPGIKNKVVRYITDKLVAAGIEGTQEAAEQLAYNAIAQLTYNPDQDLVEGLGDNFTVGSAVGALARTLLGARYARTRSERDAETLDVMEQAAAASQLRQRDPARFEALVKQLAASGADTVFVNAEQAQTYFQSAALDPASVGIDTEQLSEAVALGGDIAIPMETWLTRVAPDHGAALRDWRRIGQAGYAPGELAAAEGEVDEAVERFLASVEEGGTSDNRVYQDVVGQLLGTGMDQPTAEKNAALMQSVFRSLASRSGRDAWQLYEQYGLRIIRQRPEAAAVLQRVPNIDATMDALLDRLEAGDIPTEAQVFGPTISEFLSAKGGIRDDVMTGELARLNENDRATRRGRPRLVRQDSPDALTLDYAREAAVEAGYLPEGADINDLLDALELDRRPDVPADSALANLRDALLSLDDELRALGLDPTSDRDEIRRRLFPAGEMDQSRALDQTETPEFKAWFGDSKVVDENGRPLVVYHGTSAWGGFDKFKVSARGELGPGVYFTNDPARASSYAKKGGDGAQVVPVFLSIQNPIVVSGYDAQKQILRTLYGSDSVYNRRSAKQAFSSRLITRYDINKAISLGYDGIAHTTGYETEYTAFRPEQIKSATANRGTFDASNPNILYQSAFHGTHAKGLTKFDLSKIGSGAGNQNYGWGMYFASKREVAEFYRQTTAASATDVVRVARAMGMDGVSAQDGPAIFNAAIGNGTAAEAARRMQARSSAMRVYEIGALTRLIARVRELNTGQTYQVEIPEDSDLADWDATLDQQSPKVREALESLIQMLDASSLESWNRKIPEAKTAGTLYTLLASSVEIQPGQDPNKVASEMLLAKGIPGLRYRDGTTNTDAARGSYNYVIWDDGAIDIVRTFYQSEQDYRIQHRAPTSESGAPLHSLTDNGYYPDDVYSRNGPRFYGTGDASKDAKAFRIVNAYKGEPDAPVTIYRAVPSDVDAGINPGDWVTIVREYAEDHGNSVFDGDYKIITKQVKASQIFTNGDSIQEWGYDDGSATLSQRTEDAIRRGFIQYTSDRKFTIGLTENADLSTFLHESAHFYLEVMGDIASDSLNAPQDLVDDYMAILRWLGVDSRADIGTEQHEQFARGFEAYLGEGRPPSAELAAPFARFKAWIKAIYKTLTSLNVTLTDEVRGVFDRMIAGDDAIARAEQAMSVEPLFKEAAAAGMSPTRFREYLRLQQAAHDEAEARVTAQAMREVRREAEAWWREERAKVQGEVEAETYALPVYQAWAALSRNRTPAGEDLPTPPVKLDKGWLVRKYGQAFLNKNLLRKSVYAVEGGIDGDMAAALFGFASGDDLVTALANAAPMKAAIKAETDARMRERYGDMRLDGSLPQRAMNAVHNSKRMKAIAADIALLEGLAGEPAMNPAQVRAWAEQKIAGTKIRMLTPYAYLRAERKFAREALRQAAAGNWKEALLAQRRRLAHAHLYDVAIKAREQFEKRTKWLAKQGKPKVQERLAKAGKGYREQINAVLAAVGLRRQDPTAERSPLRAFLDELQEAGDETAVSDRVVAMVDGGTVTELREMSVATFREVYEAARNLVHLAGQRNRLLADEDRTRFKDAVDQLVQRAEEMNPDRLPEELSRRDLGAVDRAADRVRRFASELDRPENIIEALDGGESGPWHRLFWQALNRAEDKAIELRRRVGSQLKALRKSMPSGFMASLDERVDLPFGATVSRGTLLGIVLNTGNAGNLQRLRDGGVHVNGAPVQLTDAQIQQMRDMLTPDEARYVQGLWDAVNSLWPEIAALQREMSGIVPPKVEAVAFTVNAAKIRVNGEADAAAGTVAVEMRGGYWPLAYDHSKSEIGERQADDDALRVMMGAGYTRATTPKGYTKERVEKVNAPLQMDFGAVMAKHLDNVMTDLAYRRAVKDTVRLLRNAQVKDAIISRLGKGAYDTLKGAVAYAVSSGEMAGQAATTARRIVSTVVANSAVSALAIRPDIALGNYSSALLQALDRVGVRSLMRGWWTLQRGRGDLTEKITSLSPFMAQRLADIDFEYQQEITKAQGKRGYGEAYRRVVMTLHRWADHDVTRAAWWGRYQEALAAGETSAEAVRLADKLVRQTQTSSARKDVAALERDPAFRESRIFMGPMFVILGRLRAAAKGEGATRTVGARAASLMLQMFLAPSVFMLAAGRWPEDGDDDDEEIGPGEWAAWLARNTLLFPLQAIPVAREVAGAVEAWATDRPINPRAAPTAQAMAGLVKASKSISENVEDYQDTGELDWYDMTRDLAAGAGPLTGIPAGQIRITTKTIQAIQDDPEAGAVDLTRMAIYGPPKQ